MMLRSQNVPARMAIGFKGGEWNPLGMYYQVQQLHAHAWVEVYLDNDDIPADAFASDEVTPKAAWFVLDPTVGFRRCRRRGPDHRRDRPAAPVRRLRAGAVDQLRGGPECQAPATRRSTSPVTAGVHAAAENLFGRRGLARPFATTWPIRRWAHSGNGTGGIGSDWRGGLVAIGCSAWSLWRST